VKIHLRKHDTLDHSAVCGESMTELIDCRRCNGEGRMPHNKDRDCGDCYGKGKIQRRKVEKAVAEQEFGGLAESRCSSCLRVYRARQERKADRGEEDLGVGVRGGGDRSAPDGA
jgi:RecJ-like exonuclease